MELRTLFRRDLRKMRGTIICMAVLSMLIVMMCSVTFSIRDGFQSGMKEAIEACQGSDVMSFVYADRDISELYRKLEQDPETGHVVTIGAIDGISAPTVGGKSYGNDTYWCGQSAMEGQYRLFNSDCNGFEDTIPKLGKDEVYIPIGLKSFYGCEVGDTLTECFGAIPDTDENGDPCVSNDVEREFRIKGFTQMPECGSSVIGYKLFVISDEAYDELYEISERGTKVVRDNHVCNPPDYNFCQNILMIYRADSSTLSTKEYTRHLNEKIELKNYVDYGINRSEYEDYSGLYINIFYKIILAFSVILLVIVIIVLTNNISSDIENDYSELGVMKAIGFSNAKLRLRTGRIYLFAEFTGAVVGFAVSGFISKLFAVAMISNTGILASAYFIWGKTLLLIAGILAVSALGIVIKTISLRKVSPVKAVSGRKSDVTFENRGTLPVTKRALSLKVAIRAITSEPWRFIGISIITAMLCFAMMIAAGTFNMLKDDNVILSTGFEYCDFSFRPYSGAELTDEATETIFGIVNEYTEIEHFYDDVSEYVLINGDSVLCNVYKHPEEINGILKGRAPRYQNEFMCTKKVCDEYGLSIGDEVTIGMNGNWETYVLSGTNQSMNDAGFCLSMSLEGMHRINPSVKTQNIGIDLKDETKTEEIIDRINELYEEDYGRARLSSDREEFEDIFSTSTVIARLVIFSFSIIFFFVTIHMMVTKAFKRERKDLGIYKAIGFTSNRLRLIFALRFTTVSGIGAVLGIVLGFLFAGKLLGVALSITGLSYLPLDFGLTEILIVLAVCFTTVFLAGYLTSAKIKTVEVNELIVE